MRLRRFQEISWAPQKFHESRLVVRIGEKSLEGEEKIGKFSLLSCVLRQCINLTFSSILLAQEKSIKNVIECDPSELVSAHIVDPFLFMNLSMFPCLHIARAKQKIISIGKTFPLPLL